MTSIEELEQKLDSFNPAERKEALASLCEKVNAGDITLPQPGNALNIHCHTFFSYNTYGYSPTKFAWLAKKRGLAVAGVVDFDVLDGLEEFHAAAKMLELKACAGMETRVYVPQFSTRVINSPGEPGISYHMGVGFPKAKLEGDPANFLRGLKETAQQRNKDLMGRVNKYLSPVELDYEKDVLPLTPAGNATERHICLAYARKAQQRFGDIQKLTDYWSQKLSADAAKLGLPEGGDMLNTIRVKTMKRGGVGYVQPDKGSFPTLAKTNEFFLATGAMPTWTWLDGTSDGEQAIEELLDVAVTAGCVALNVIPDRNYTAGKTDQKLKNLYKVVESAEKLNLVLIEGTEMNSPGQKFVDDFDTAEFSPLTPVFLKGAHIAYAHSVLQRRCGLGYTSAWAAKNFEDIKKRNAFFEKVGRILMPADEDKLTGLSEKTTPREILKKTST
jgi:hypothetical protein